VATDQTDDFDCGQDALDNQKGPQCRDIRLLPRWWGGRVLQPRCWQHRSGICWHQSDDGSGASSGTADDLGSARGHPGHAFMLGGKAPELGVIL